MPQAASSKLKAVLPTLISSKQAALVKNTFIGESGRLISDITKINNEFNVEVFPVTMDTKNAFDYLNYNFLSSAFKKFALCKAFIIWIEILLKNQQ